MTVLPVFAALLVACGLAACAWGLAERRKARATLLAELLDRELADPSARPEHLAELVERAGAVAERLLARTSATGGVQLTLTRAGLALRPGEAVAILAIATGLVAAAVWLWTASPAAALVVSASAGAALAGWVARKARDRVRRVEEQLPSVLQLLAGSLESGASVLHALELVVEEGEPPLTTELDRVIAETRVGRSLIDALEAMAERIGSHDLDWTVEAIRIQHRSGGKLADTLRVLAGFMRARVEVRGEVRALSAEARLSAKVLTILPIAVAGYLFAFRRSYLEPLYTTPMGRMMIAVALGGLVLGSLWMRRIVRVEV